MLIHPAVGMIAKIIAAAALFAHILPNPALAWGDEGHRIIAMIARLHLTPTAQALVEQLLAADTDTLTAPDFASRATWADRYRDSDRNTTQQRYLLTRAWHFVDIEIDQPDLATACYGHPPAATPASGGPANACVVDRIDAFMSELRTLPRGDPERLFAFKFLLHLVGDLHQPLHAADHRDRGGNAVLVLFNGRTLGSPLHAWWDNNAVAALGRNPLQIASWLERRFGSSCVAWQQGTTADWAIETFTVGRDVAYALGESKADASGRAAFRLTATYQQRASEVAAEQLAKAGCRLAGLLNDVLQ